MGNFNNEEIIKPMSYFSEDDFEYQSLYRTLQSLVGCGYVEYGIKAGRSYTYFLNSKGSKFLETKIIPPDYEEEVSDDETEY